MILKLMDGKFPGQAVSLMAITLIYQGTVLIDPDTKAMFKALNVAKSKLQKRELDDAASRVTSLKALLGEAP